MYYLLQTSPCEPAVTARIIFNNALNNSASRNRLIKLFDNQLCLTVEVVSSLSVVRVFGELRVDQSVSAVRLRAGWVVGVQDMRDGTV